MSKRKTIEDCHKLAAEHGGKFLGTEYKNCSTKYPWECRHKHIFYTCYNKVQQKRWCPICAKELRKQTWLKNYGVDNPSKAPEIKKKKEKKALEKYGVKCVLYAPKIRQKVKKTMLERYGVDNPSKNRDLALKAAKSMNNSFVSSHWKTGEEIICVASYEKKVIDYLNKNKIDFRWQIPFILPDGKTYFCDLYLPDKNIWVEIKGYFRGDAKKKWNWFHWFMPNSELWNKDKLKEMNIL